MLSLNLLRHAFCQKVVNFCKCSKLLLFFLCSTGNLIQGLMYARQAFYHWLLYHWALSQWFPFCCMEAKSLCRPWPPVPSPPLSTHLTPFTLASLAPLVPFQFVQQGHCTSHFLYLECSSPRCSPNWLPHLPTSAKMSPNPPFITATPSPISRHSLTSYPILFFSVEFAPSGLLWLPCYCCPSPFTKGHGGGE
jgi:hypothetical protein